MRKITVVSDTPMRVALVGVDAANLYESYRKKALPTYVLLKSMGVSTDFTDF